MQIAPLLALAMSIAALGVASAATIRTVAPTGSGDYPTIQAAIEACDSLDVVELLDGTYTGPGNRNLDFGGRSITLRSRGGDPLACTLDCQGDSAAFDEPRRGLLFQSGEDSSSVVRGITITGGVSGGD